MSEDNINQTQSSNSSSASRRSSRPRAPVKYFEEENDDTTYHNNNNHLDTDTDILPLRKQPPARHSNDTNDASLTPSVDPSQLLALNQKELWHPHLEQNPSKEIITTTRSGRQLKLNKNYYSDNSEGDNNTTTKSAAEYTKNSLPKALTTIFQPVINFIITIQN